MAVPASGNSISLAGLAAEKDIDDYTDADYDDVLSLKDITVGGNNNGNSFVADATNAFSASHPDNVAPFKMSEFYSYDHDASSPACNLAYQSGEQGTYNYPINLGSDTGIVTIEYQAYGIPDKFVFTWNGNTYTSGSGNGTGAGFVGSQSYLTALQATPGNSNATITTLSPSAGRGTITFDKNSAVTVSNMQVSAPLGSTQWWFSVSCPGQQVIGGGTGLAPTAVTNDASSVSSSGFTMNGNITSKGLTSNFSTTGTVTHRGFIVKTGNITTNFIAGESGVDTHLVDNNNSTGTISKALTGLSVSTTYTYRAYATNAAGTTYGVNKKSTTTASSTTPGIVTNNATNITSSTMTFNGNLTSTGGATVTAKGFVYSTGLLTNPQLGGMGVTNITAFNPNVTGSYTANVSGLGANTTHHIKAYATNANGTAYGSKVTAQTQQAFVTRYVSGPYGKVLFACFTTMNLVIKFQGTFANGTQVYDSNLNLMNSSNGGDKWYGGPPANSSGATSGGYFYVNSSGVVSNYAPLGC